jgi:hypothetical protein
MYKSGVVLLAVLCLISLFQNCGKMDSMSGQILENASFGCFDDSTPIADIRVSTNGNLHTFTAIDADGTMITTSLDWTVNSGAAEIEFFNQNSVLYTSTGNCSASVQVNYSPNGCNDGARSYAETVDLNCAPEFVFEQDSFPAGSFQCPNGANGQSICSYGNGYLILDGYYSSTSQWATYNLSQPAPQASYQITIRVDGGTPNIPYQYQTGARGRFQIIKPDNTTVQLWEECLSSSTLQFETKTFNYTGAIKGYRMQSQKESCPGDTGPWRDADGEFINLDYVKIESL